MPDEWLGAREQGYPRRESRCRVTLCCVCGNVQAWVAAAMLSRAWGVTGVGVPQCTPATRGAGMSCGGDVSY